MSAVQVSTWKTESADTFMTWYIHMTEMCPQFPCILHVYTGVVPTLCICRVWEDIQEHPLWVTCGLEVWKWLKGFFNTFKGFSTIQNCAKKKRRTTKTYLSCDYRSSSAGAQVFPHLSLTNDILFIAYMTVSQSLASTALLHVQHMSAKACDWLMVPWTWHHQLRTSGGPPCSVGAGTVATEKSSTWSFFHLGQ